MTRARFVCYDDALARTFEPFALTRPWSEMRVGALLVRERWAHALGAVEGRPATAVGVLAGDAMREVTEAGAPRAVRRAVPAGTWIVHARCAVALAPIPADSVVLRCGERVAAVRLATDEPPSTFADGQLTLDTLARRHQRGRRGHPLAGRWIDAVWDVVGTLGPLLAEDIPVLARTRGAVPLPSAAGVVVRGAQAVWCDADVQVEPHTLFDTSAGPILLGRGAVVQAFTRLSGPCVVGAHSTISGGRVGGSAIGDTCKVHGEVSASVFVGHTNKGHDGFVGHSVLGRWVNLGAGTTTSNLKNTYGPVALWTPGGLRETGLTFLGTLFGDHVKTGIGLRLTTGCVLGAGANVVDAMPPKVVSPFAWGAGAPYATYDVDRFVETAARVMARRGLPLPAAQARHLRRAHARRWNAS